MHKLYTRCGAQRREGSLANTDMSVSQHLFPPLPFNYVRQAQHISSRATVSTCKTSAAVHTAFAPSHAFPAITSLVITRRAFPLSAKSVRPESQPKQPPQRAASRYECAKGKISFHFLPVGASTEKRHGERGGWLSRDLMKVPTKKVRFTIHESKPMFVLEGPPAFSALCFSFTMKKPEMFGEYGGRETRGGIGAPRLLLHWWTGICGKQKLQARKTWPRDEWDMIH